MILEPVWMFPEAFRTPINYTILSYWFQLMSPWQDFLIPESTGLWKIYDPRISDKRASTTDPATRVGDRVQYTDITLGQNMVGHEKRVLILQKTHDRKSLFCIQKELMYFIWIPGWLGIYLCIHIQYVFILKTFVFIPSSDIVFYFFKYGL